MLQKQGYSARASEAVRRPQADPSISLTHLYKKRTYGEGTGLLGVQWIRSRRRTGRYQAREPWYITGIPVSDPEGRIHQHSMSKAATEEAWKPVHQAEMTSTSLRRTTTAVTNELSPLVKDL